MVYQDNIRITPRHYVIELYQLALSFLFIYMIVLINRAILKIFFFRDRVLMFRNEVHQDKITLGIIENESVSPQSTLITVHRLVRP